MKNKRQFPMGNAKGRQIFQRLLAMMEEGRYDDDFLAALVAYREMYPQSEKFAIFFAIVVAIVLRFSPIEKQVGEAPLPKVEESLKSEQVKKEVGLSVTSLSTDTLELDDHAERFLIEFV